MVRKAKPAAGQAAGSVIVAGPMRRDGQQNNAAGASAQGAAPVISTVMSDGRVLLRIFADRRAARRAMKRRDRDDVLDLNIPSILGLRGIRLELTFHDGPAEAEAAARDALADLELAAAPARGRG